MNEISHDDRRTPTRPGFTLTPPPVTVNWYEMNCARS
jgi:hypothetical protein